MYILLMRFSVKDIFGKQDWSKNQNDFFNQFLSKTVVNGIITDRIWQDRVRLRIQVNGNRPTSIKLQEIATIDHGQGHAKHGLNFITSLASQFDLSVRVWVFPFDTGRKNRLLTSQEDLEAWYIKHGFVHDDRLPTSSGFMIKTPQ